MVPKNSTAANDSAVFSRHGVKMLPPMEMDGLS